MIATLCVVCLAGAGLIGGIILIGFALVAAIREAINGR